MSVTLGKIDMTDAQWATLQAHGATLKEDRGQYWLYVGSGSSGPFGSIEDAVASLGSGK